MSPTNRTTAPEPRRPQTVARLGLSAAWASLGALALAGLVATFSGAPAKASSTSAAMCSAENNAAFIEQYGDKKVVDKTRFYEELQKVRLFNRYTKEGRHFIGTDAIVDEWNENYALEDPAMLAYILATAWHETGTRMYPIREAFATSDEAAIRALDRHFKNRTSNIYWRPVAETGRAYFGRGYVQLTWDWNYKNADNYLGIDPEAPDYKEISYYWEPDNALKERPSIQITYSGMFLGWYTKRCLLNYFQPNKRPDWAGARRIINGVDKKEKIAAEAVAFYEVLNKPDVLVPPADLAERLAKREADEKAAQEAAEAEQQAALDVALDRAALKDTRDRLSDTERLVLELQNRIEALEADRLAQLERNAAISAEFVSLRETNDNVNAQIDALVDQNTALRNEIELVRGFAQAEAQRAADTRRALVEENERLRQEVRETRAAMENASRLFDALRTDTQTRLDDLAARVRLANERTLWDFIFGRSPSDDG